MSQQQVTEITERENRVRKNPLPFVSFVLFLPFLFPGNDRATTAVEELNRRSRRSQRGAKTYKKKSTILIRLIRSSKQRWPAKHAKQTKGKNGEKSPSLFRVIRVFGGQPSFCLVFLIPKSETISKLKNDRNLKRREVAKNKGNTSSLRFLLFLPFFSKCLLAKSCNPRPGATTGG